MLGDEGLGVSAESEVYIRSNWHASVHALRCDIHSRIVITAAIIYLYPFVEVRDLPYIPLDK